MGHRAVTLGANHAELDCTACHEAHDGSASCTGSGCHEPFAAECEPPQTHDKPHAQVSCSACHDAQGLEIIWNEGTAKWDTAVAYREGELRPYTSHNLALEVDCDRCHEPGNHPWGY
jgi:hypothetical protein